MGWDFCTQKTAKSTNNNLKTHNKRTINHDEY